MKWQPIESAPKDRAILGRVVVDALRGAVDLYIVRWDDDRYAKRPRPFWRRGGEDRITDARENPPSHWMELPSKELDDEKEKR